MTEFKVGDEVYVDGPAIGVSCFDPYVAREIFLHDQTGQLRVYDDRELYEEYPPVGWWIDGFAIKPYVRHV